MSSKKTTINVEEQLLKDLDTIALARGISRNKIIVDVVQNYVNENIDIAREILVKAEELKSLKETIK